MKPEVLTERPSLSVCVYCVVFTVCVGLIVYRVTQRGLASQLEKKVKSQ